MEGHGEVSFKTVRIFCGPHAGGPVFCVKQKTSANEERRKPM